MPTPEENLASFVSGGATPQMYANYNAYTGGQGAGTGYDSIGDLEYGNPGPFDFSGNTSVTPYVFGGIDDSRLGNFVPYSGPIYQHTDINPAPYGLGTNFNYSNWDGREYSATPYGTGEQFNYTNWDGRSYDPTPYGEGERFTYDPLDLEPMNWEQYGEGEQFNYDPLDLPQYDYGQFGDPIRELEATPEELRDQAYDYYYEHEAARLDPYWDEQSNAIDIQLRNQGLTPGDEAYDRAYANMTRARTDAYEQARTGAFGRSQSEADMRFNQQLQASGFYNQTRQGEINNYNIMRQVMSQEQAQQFAQQATAMAHNEGVRQVNIQAYMQGRALTMQEQQQIYQQSFNQAAFHENQRIANTNAYFTAGQMDMQSANMQYGQMYSNAAFNESQRQANTQAYFQAGSLDQSSAALQYNQLYSNASFNEAQRQANTGAYMQAQGLNLQGHNMAFQQPYLATQMANQNQQWGAQNYLTGQGLGLQGAGLTLQQQQHMDDLMWRDYVSERNSFVDQFTPLQLALMANPAPATP